MRKTCFGLFMILSLVSLHAQLSRRVLFLGNSYTYENNLPKLIRDIALTTGDTLIYDSNLIGAYTLANHGNDAVSISKLSAGNWDYVVLQEQSQLPSFPSYGSTGLNVLSQLNKKHNRCGRLLFYMTWGRKNGDAMNCATWPPVCTYLGMDTLLRRRYIEMGDIYKGDVSPAGSVWRYLRMNHPSLNLYQADESHPSLAGSFAAACSFYASIFKKNPVFTTYNPGLSAADAAIIRNAAKLVVFDSLSYWTTPVVTPTANFSYVIGNGPNEVIFTNSTLNQDAVQWQFGDGNSSDSLHPVHNYAANGIYTITLTALNCDIDTTYYSTVQQTISFCPFTPTISPPAPTVCPSANLVLSTQVHNQIQWFDATGTPVPNGTGNTITAVPGNTYYVEATLNGCRERSTQVFVNMFSHLGKFYMFPEGSSKPDTACLGEDVRLILSPYKPPYLYADSQIYWFKDGTGLLTHNDTLPIFQTGSYTVLLKDKNCAEYDFTATLDFVFVDCNTGISEKLLNEISFGPNPANEKITIWSENGVTRYSLMNMLGTELMSGFCSSGDVVDIGNLDAGIYLIRFDDRVPVKLLKE